MLFLSAMRPFYTAAFVSFLVAFKCAVGLGSVLDEAKSAIRDDNLPQLYEILNNVDKVDLLKKQMYDEMTWDRNLLSYAVHFGDLKGIELMTARLEPNWNQPDANGRIPSWSQAYRKYFISADQIDFSVRNGLGWTIFHKVAKDNDLEAVKLISSKIGSPEKMKNALNILNENSESPLYYANSNEMRKLLLDMGADPMKGRSLLNSLVRSACDYENEVFFAKVQRRYSDKDESYCIQQTGKNLMAVKLFLDAGVSPTALDPQSQESFYSLAKKSGRLSHVELAFSSPHFDWKQELGRSGLKVLEGLKWHLNRRTGILAEREEELSSYSHVSNYLDLAQIGLDVNCSICRSTAGTKEVRESGGAVTGIVVHTCGKLFCDICFTDHSAQKQVPDCPSCGGTKDFLRLAPEFSSSKDRRLQRPHRSHPIGEVEL